ncbi:MAG: response regulator transcription factor [Phycisphaerales bacterium]|nr:response regulator transcription factor [Phycisphaerales bacterium]
MRRGRQSTARGEPTGGPPGGAYCIDRFLVTALTVPAGVVDADGVVVELNEAMGEWEGRSPEELVGRHVSAFAAPARASELEATASATIGDGEPRVTAGMHKGHWLRFRYYRAETPGEGSLVCIMAVDPWRSDALEDGAGERIVESRHHDLADLAALSTREGEVLWHLGRGKSLPRIASELYRSVKTMEAHVRSIGVKLGLRGRVAMISLVQDRGLSHMTLEQVKLVFGSGDRAGT